MANKHIKIFLDVPNLYGNANQYHNEILPHTLWDGYYQKKSKPKKEKQKITSASKGVEKLEPL